MPPPRFRTVHWTVGRGMCPRCHKTFEGTVPGAMPRFAATNTALAGILRPCVRRLWRWLRESKVRHADETTWPCNGAHGQYDWGFFAKFVALFLFWKTRGGAVPGTVFAGVRDGVTVHDGYTAYDTPCEDASQQCYAHVMRRFERLLK